ncbi:cryptic nitrate reductase 2 subunit alpha [Shigella flexneri]|nr:cryptic nitrate reductase 2 subunit alpha [Shigella flexneri]
MPSDGIKPEEVEWQTAAIEGKLDLLVTLDFRMSSTCLFSDIVLPTATWYEKDDMNTSDMHPFIHPLSAAVDPGLGITQRLGNLQRYCQSIFASVRGPSWQRNRRGITTTAA